MISGSPRRRIEPLTKEQIFERLDEHSIFSFYMGTDIDFRKKYSSPFRSDRSPNFCFFPTKKGEIRYKDFATGESGDCFKFVERKFNINFYEALEKINHDFNLFLEQNKEKSVIKFKIPTKKDPIHNQSKIIQITTKPFTYEELSYWENYQINQQELKRKNVYSVDKLFLGKRLIPNYNNELRFAYLFDDYLKIYSPFSKQIKWISSCPNEYISGFDDIKYKIFSGTQDEKLIISKSVKDEIILSKFFKDVCSTQNESSQSISPENMQWILKGYKPENVYMAYDNDEAGVKASTYFTKNYGFKYVNVPKIYSREGIKDWADLVKHKDLDTLENYLKIKKLI